MDGVTGLLIKLGVRLLVFGAVFYFAAHKNPRIVIRRKWATPLIAFVFAFLNTALYWALTPLLNIATLGAVGFIMPFIVNAILLVGTVRVFASLRDKLAARAAQSQDATKSKDKPEAPKALFEIDGIFATLWMAAFLTAAHGALWVALDYIPNR